MPEWTTRLRLDPKTLLLLVTTPEGDILRARLPRRPKSPRALLTLLEGIALWSGKEITVATSVDANWVPSDDDALFGGGFWPAETNLVRYQILPRRVPCRIRGVGDFRKLYRIPKFRGGA